MMLAPFPDSLKVIETNIGTNHNLLSELGKKLYFLKQSLNYVKYNVNVVFPRPDTQMHSTVNVVLP